MSSVSMQMRLLLMGIGDDSFVARNSIFVGVVVGHEHKKYIVLFLNKQ